MGAADLELLRAHNPVPDSYAAVDPTARAAALDRALACADRVAPPTSGARRSQRRRAWWPLVTIVALLVLAAAALAASGILSGTAYDPPWAHERPGVDLGVPVAGSAQLLSLRVPDPAGGPPWGLRVVRTTRGYECVELGRVLNGRLGVLGQDGWFGDDHRFHPMPASVYDSEACGLVGSAGYALAGTWETTFANGIGIVGGCQYPGPKWALNPKLPTCPARDQRFVAYGLAGPGARAITYTQDGTHHVLRTDGTQGAYLLVRAERRLLIVHGSAAGGPGLAGGGGPGSFPGAVAVSYRDGRVCPSKDPGPDTCVQNSFTITQLHVHLQPVRVRVMLHRARPQLPGTFDAMVRFRAPVTISSGALDYTFKAVNPGAHNTASGSLDRNVRQGSTVNWLVNIPACTRHAKITIYLNGATALSQPWRLNAPAIATVATASFQLPTVRHVPWC